MFSVSVLLHVLLGFQRWWVAHVVVQTLCTWLGGSTLHTVWHHDIWHLTTWHHDAVQYYSSVIQSSPFFRQVRSIDGNFSQNCWFCMSHILSCTIHREYTHCRFNCNSVIQSYSDTVIQHDAVVQLQFSGQQVLDLSSCTTVATVTVTVTVLHTMNQ